MEHPNTTSADYFTVAFSLTDPQDAKPTVEMLNQWMAHTEIDWINRLARQSGTKMTLLDMAADERD